MTKSKKLIIIGTGETARIAYTYFSSDSVYDVIAFSVESKFIDKEEEMGLPIVPFEELENKFPSDEFDCHVAISFTNLNAIRALMYEKTKEKGYNLASFISSQAYVAPNAEIGDNCFLYNHVSVGPFAKVKNNTILCSGVLVSHSSELGNHIFAAPGAAIGGFTKVGDFSFLGLNCTIVDKLSLSEKSLISAGAFLTKSTDTPNLYAGHPAEDSKLSSELYFRMNGGVL